MARLTGFLLMLVVASSLGVVASQHQARKLYTAVEREQQRSQQLVTAPCCCHGRSAATSNIAGKAGKQRPASCRLRLLLVRCSKAVKQPGPNRWPVRRGWRYRQRLRVRWTTQRRGAGTGTGGGAGGGGAGAGG